MTEKMIYTVVFFRRNGTPLPGGVHEYSTSNEALSNIDSWRKAASKQLKPDLQCVAVQDSFNNANVDEDTRQLKATLFPKGRYTPKEFEKLANQSYLTRVATSVIRQYLEPLFGRS